MCSGTIITASQNGKQLHLGAHLVNDVNHPHTSLNKNIGCPLKNNAQFIGVYLVATRVIAIGQDFFVDYNYGGGSS